MEKIKKNRPLSISAVLLLAVATSCVTPESTPVEAPRAPVRLILGVDISGTTKNFQRMDTSFLKQVIAKCKQSKRTVYLAFKTIGDVTDKNFIRAAITALPTKNANDPLYVQEKIQNEIIALEKFNNEEEKRFLNDVNLVLKNVNQADTDLNGFFKMSNFLMSEFPAHTIVCIQSDGYQDTNNKKLDCNILDKNSYLAAVGWKNSEECHFDARPEGLQGFIFVLRELLKQ